MTLTSAIPSHPVLPKVRLMPNLQEILFMSLNDAIAFKPEAGDILVSIRTAGDHEHTFQGYDDVIYVQTPVEEFWTGGREKLFALGHQLSKDLNDRRGAKRVVFHCQYGEIRSKTLACCLSSYLAETGLPDLPVKTYGLVKLFPDQKKRHAKTGKVKVIPGATRRDLVLVANSECPDGQLAAVFYDGLHEHLV